MMLEATSDPIIAAIVAARAGRQSEAAQILARITKAPNRHDLPIGFIIGALRQSGVTALADWLHDRAIARGLDVTARVPAFDSVLATSDAVAATAICRRYEQAFSQGAINAGMVGRYAVALSRAGEWDKLAALYPAGKTVLQVQLDAVEGFGGLKQFNDEVISEIRDSAEEEMLDGRNYMQGALRYHKVHKIGRPAVSNVIAIAEQAFDTFMAAFPTHHDNPLNLMRPDYRHIIAWANMYETDPSSGRICTMKAGSWRFIIRASLR